MNTFNIERLTKNVTIPINASQGDCATSVVNGLLRGIVVNAPAITGTSYKVYILGQRGETLFSKDTLTPNAVTAILIDANNYPLQIPLSLNGVAAVRIKDNGDPAATGVLTFDNAGPILDGETVTIGNVVYTFKTTLTGAANEILIVADIAAAGTLTSNNTNVSDNDTVTIGSTVYRFKTTIAQIRDIHIGGSADASLTNLAAAINGTGTAGTDYFTGTPVDPNVTSGAVTAHAIVLTAKVKGTSGNSIAFAKSAATLTVDAATLGTTTLGAWSGDTTLTNLKKAINHEATEGTNYGTGTVANPYVTSSAVSSHAITLSAVASVNQGSDVATTETGAHLSFGAATLTGGEEGSQRVYNVDLLIQH